MNKEQMNKEQMNGGEKNKEHRISNTEQGISNVEGNKEYLLSDPLFICSLFVGSIVP